MKTSLKQKTWQIYDQWRQEKIFSPAINDFVRFSLKGWQHLIGAPGKRKRNPKDIYRRLILLPYAKIAIKDKKASVKTEKRGKCHFYILETTLLIKGKRKIRVILLEDQKRNKIFYSIMDKQK